MKRTLITCLLVALTACATPPTRDCPHEGGIGGTGGCPPSEALQ